MSNRDRTEDLIMSVVILVVMAVLCLSWPIPASAGRPDCPGNSCHEQGGDDGSNGGGSATVTVVGGNVDVDSTIINRPVNKQTTNVSNRNSNSNVNRNNNSARSTSSSKSSSSSKSNSKSDSNSSASTGPVTVGGDHIEYPDNPVSSPAAALGGVCSTNASLTTKDVGLSLGTSDPLCRQMELVKMAIFLNLKAEAEEHYNEAVRMEKQANWFRRSRIGGFCRGLPVVGRFF